MKKNILPLLIVSFSFIGTSAELRAQTARKVVVEHFTNTRCGICGSRNPGLTANLSTSPDVLHVSYHPSSPYSSCLLNKHNVSGNDDRTKYYGVYGATPRVVVQGSAKGNGESFTSKDLFKAEQGKMTPIDIKLTTLQKGKDSLVVKIVITNLASNALKDMSIYAIAVEDTVFYQAPNGEKEHHNVFREALLNQPLTIPSTVGDSVVFVARTANNNEWNASRMYVMAFAQTSDKKIEQVASSEGDADIDDGGGTNSVHHVSNKQFSLFPNPTNGIITIQTAQNAHIESISISDLLGNIVQTIPINRSGIVEIDISELPNGTYFTKVGLKDSEGALVKKLVILK